MNDRLFVESLAHFRKQLGDVFGRGKIKLRERLCCGVVRRHREEAVERRGESDTRPYKTITKLSVKETLLVPDLQ